MWRNISNAKPKHVMSEFIADLSAIMDIMSDGSQEPDPNVAPSSTFMRTTSGGVFKVEGYSPTIDVDILEPSKITDFRSMRSTYNENRTVELTWTAVGDDLDQGTGGSLEMEYTK